jgi:hypothetical protein
MINHSKLISLPISFFTREREIQGPGLARFLMDNELLHKGKDFVDALMGSR